jgi:hypothetical protein
MTYVGLALFVVVFLLLAPTTRGALLSHLGMTMEWARAWAPFSYILILAVLVSPFVAYIIMRSWPEVKEPEDPLARYRRGDDVLED